MHARTRGGDDTLDGANVLIVDDEPAVLAGLRRSLNGQLRVHTCEDPNEALQLAAELPELAVVVSDMRMPGMDGATLLQRMRTVAPDAVRVLLTGYTGVEAAVAAINDGAIFRFLWKPCGAEALHSCLRDAVEQHRLLTAERELLERTLRGSIRALLEVLSLANPLAFSRAERIRVRVSEIAARIDGADRWHIEVAAMLSQLGAITLPPEVSEHLHRGLPVDGPLRHLVELIPERSADLLADVPRFEEVRRSIIFQDQRFDGRGPVNDMAGEQLPLGARILRVAIDLDALEMRGSDPAAAIAELRAREGRYDPSIVAIADEVLCGGPEELPAVGARLTDLRPGMQLADDVVTDGGQLVCGRGQTITHSILDRLAGWPAHDPIAEPIHVRHLAQPVAL